ncbi:hypothetical protein OB13_01030 [Pontibacter sp. HJ8]
MKYLLLSILKAIAERVIGIANHHGPGSDTLNALQIAADQQYRLVLYGGYTCESKRERACGAAYASADGVR